jgi:hypothetical protein
VPGGGKAGGEAVSYELFVFEDEALEEAFLGCRAIQGSDVELAQGV